MSHRTEIDSTWWRIAAAWILIASALLRFYALDLKPLHHDEGVNGFFLVNLIRSSAAYRYDPSNYHGPTLYYFARASVAVFGLTTVAIRFVPALFGALTICLVLAWRTKIGGIGSLVSAALLALSPGAVYMSRYFIHEALLVFFTLGAIAGFARYIDSRRPRDLVLAAAALGLMFATKETAIIATGIGVVALALTYVLARGLDVSRPADVRDPARTPVGTRQTIIAGATAFAVFVAINVLFFSSFFSHPEAVPDAVKGFLPWARTGAAAHLHPWSSYLRWMAQEEAGVLVLGAIGAAVALATRDNAFALFAALWGTGMLTAYSLVPYKTPWLTLNLIAPLAVVAGYGVDQLWLRSRRTARVVMAGLGTVIAIAATTQAVNLNFFHYDDPAYPYVYVHTQRDLLRLVTDVDAVAAARAPQTGRFHVTVTSPQQFPLSWYLRNYDVGYYKQVVATDDVIVIGGEQQDDDLASMLGQSYERKSDYMLRPGVRLVLYVRR